MTTKTILFIAGLTLLTGCATQAKYKQIVNSWIDYSESSLISEWGPPISTYESGGYKYLTYSNNRNLHLPGTSPSYQTTLIGSTAYTTPIGGSAPVNLALHCQTTFQVDNRGIIKSARWQGNNCVAK
ncbi:hypothetical protein [Kiloniella spongiae]|uniref:hypothetical protein n=1 Tax=Kiloniella spongiae TaxID=1489064 RepID=UPI0012E09D57|nr:hypothetical protein [Kiloniella spongiae]